MTLSCKVGFCDASFLTSNNNYSCHVKTACRTCLTNHMMLHHVLLIVNSLWADAHICIHTCCVWNQFLETRCAPAAGQHVCGLKYLTRGVITTSIVDVSRLHCLKCHYLVKCYVISLCSSCSQWWSMNSLGQLIPSGLMMMMWAFQCTLITSSYCVVLPALHL